LDTGDSGDAMESHDMNEEDVLACRFDAWFERFRSVTFKSEVLPLSEEFVKYLHGDGIRLRRASDQSSEDSWGEGGKTQKCDANSDTDSEVEEANFPELEERIRAAILRLKGHVLPKLNWSAPKDAQWIYGTLRCSSVEEILTLLKASDFVAHDLVHSFSHCNTNRTRPDTFTLVLRRWHDLRESGEFRCFVKDSNLVAVSQRKTSGLFEHINQKSESEAILAAIQDFFESTILPQFPLQNYVVDVYVDAAPRRRLWLVDFSPWGSTTDPCLFEWDELKEMATGQEVDLRVVRNQGECRSKLENYHCLPVEIATLNSQDNQQDFLEKAEKLLKQKEGTSQQ